MSISYFKFTTGKNAGELLKVEKLEKMRTERIQISTKVTGMGYEMATIPAGRFLVEFEEGETFAASEADMKNLRSLIEKGELIPYEENRNNTEQLSDN